MQRNMEIVHDALEYLYLGDPRKAESVAKRLDPDFIETWYHLREKTKREMHFRQLELTEEPISEELMESSWSAPTAG